MKRLFCMVLVVALLCSATAHAEEFTLRNGIKFGDSMEEVLQKETIAIKSVKDGGEEDALTEADDSGEEDAETEYPYSITTEKATVAGIDDTQIWYRFDAEKTLREVVYEFPLSSNRDTTDSDYDTVNAALIRKYGSPLGFSGGDCYIVSGNALESAALMTLLYESLFGYGDIRDYDEWDVDAGDYHVKIEQVEFYYGSSYSELKYSHRMSYTYFTNDDLFAAMQEKRDQQAAIDNDI